MTAIVVLQAERALFADPKRLCRGAFARDKRGRKVPPDARAAVSWCLIGALDGPARGSGDWEMAESLLHRVARENGHRNAQRANDTLDHAGVLALIDEAIAVAKAGEGVS